MTSRFRQNVTFAVAFVCLSIAVLLAVFWYLAMATNVFHAQSSTSTYRINENNVKTLGSSTTLPPSLLLSTSGPRLTPPGNSGSSSEFPITTTASPATVSSSNDCTDLDGVELISTNFFDPDVLRKNGILDYVCVRPIKMHKKSLHTDDLLYESKHNGSGQNHSATHFTGEFRKMDSRIWDPHPQYIIEAFGQKMRLDLYNDGSFIHKDMKVTHSWANETLRRKIDHDDHDELRGCFYRGSVYADAASTVSVSLCTGMTGHIRTHQGTFMIKPVETFAEDKRSILHVIYRLQSPSPGEEYIDDIVHNGQSPVPESNAIDPPHHDLYGSSMPKIESFDLMLDTLHGGDVKRRTKRTTRNNPHNNEYTMEILVAVDKKMQEYHGDETRNYVLTLMSIVSNIFADASIGNSISIAVVHIMFLQENVAHDANGIGVEASKMLMDFCRIKNMKYKHDHDTALLLTREQICRNPSETKCDTLGLAELGTICRKESCSLVQDNGLSAAFTIAHELGHILNMPHDDDSKCNQFYGNQKKEHFIMSRMLGKNTHPWAWSNCSRHFATEYLENNHGSCMLNTPTHGVIEPNTGNSQLAGEKFTQHQQCELVFGPGTKICSYMPECSSLWCVTSGDKPDEGCRSQAMPWADGTPCGGHGSNKWCQKAKCVPRNRDALRPVDGGWGQWSPWSKCSLPCGGGIQSSQRYCDSPAPANYGKYCTGHRVQYRSCNTENCPPNMMDVRSQQCREFDNNNFDIASLHENVKWVPKYGVSPSDECKLYCRVKDNSLYFLLKHKVKDGTPCNQDGFDKCVNGHCHQAGCDNQLYSTAVLDKCGVCNGNNNTCEEVNGSMTRQELKQLMGHSKEIYHRVAVIPEGALNIEIRQPGYPDDKSFIALRGVNKENLLNAESSITNFPREFAYAGVLFKYNGANQSMEMVTTTYATMLHKPLIVELLIVRTSFNDLDWLRGDQEIISYTYTIAKSHPKARDIPSSPMVLSAQHPGFGIYGSNSRSHHHRQQQNYQWKMSEFGTCDKLCYGKRYRTAVCVKMEEAQQVDHNYCSAHTRPQDESEDCNTNCYISWGIKKSNCSVVCGDGYRTVEHVCTQKFNTEDRVNYVDDVHCPEILNKFRTEKCTEKCLDALWVYGQWDACSQKCGGGTQNRTSYCYSQPGGYPVDNVVCQSLPKDDSRVCNIEPCPEWVYDENTPCSVTCGEGVRSRVVRCKQKDSLVNSSLCAHMHRPITRPVPCTMPACAAKKVTSSHVMNMEDTKYTVVQQHPNSLYPSFHPKHTTTTPAPEIITAKFEWKTGRWGNCSTCGSYGKRLRSVRCSKTTTGYDVRYVEDHYCDLKMRPVNISSCADVSCNIWNYNQWSECNDNCEMTRQVICQNEQERLSESQCDATKRPPERKSCCHIKWRSIWTTCSGTCGYGERTRKKVCMKLMPKTTKNPHPVKTGKILDERMCRGLPEPKYSIFSRPCRKPCAFQWKVSDYGKCDAGCGSGIASRQVICTNGTSTSEVDCDPKKKPKRHTVCQSKEHCVWKVKKFKSSQCKCDGYQKVRTVCFDDVRKRRSTYCNEADRPPHKQPCTPNPPYCSCRDVRHHYKRDGEYGLNVAGRNVSIYCHGLHTDHPREYLTLKAGNTENYALYHGNRSKLMNSCPYDPNDTFMDEGVPSGTTRFNKVRVKVNLDHLQVVDDDYEFAMTTGQRQAFGSAGDCFSNTGDCPQGVFRINLEGTGVMLSKDTEWETDGSHAVLKFHTPLRAPYVNVIGRCGGYCGKCRPTNPLRLSVMPTV